MKRIIFVGMHNKPDKNPLCHSTKTGKLISKIIKNIDSKNCIRTNLYDIDYYPLKNEKKHLAQDWIERIQPEENDIIVLLGAEVHKNYIPTNGIVIKVPHPSSQRSLLDISDYIFSVSNKIKSAHKTQRIYISGQITGLEYNDAYSLFEWAEKEIQNIGHRPVNPMKEIPFNENWNWKDYMIEDIKILFDCDGMAMLPNWKSSKGAKIENAIAEHLGMEIIYLKI